MYYDGRQPRTTIIREESAGSSVVWVLVVLFILFVLFWVILGVLIKSKKKKGLKLIAQPPP